MLPGLQEVIFRMQARYGLAQKGEDLDIPRIDPRRIILLEKDVALYQFDFLQMILGYFLEVPEIRLGIQGKNFLRLEIVQQNLV